MRILIIEDEHYAAKRLKTLLVKQIPDLQILDVLDSVEQSIEWLASHVSPNLIFLDIQLADGLSFQIFDKVKVTCPIIFTTAFDEYALQAFKVNSIDYLLKPIDNIALKNALDKYNSFFSSNIEHINWDQLAKSIHTNEQKFKQRFLIKMGSAFAYLQIQEIKYMFSEDGLTFAITDKDKKVIIDHSLDQIELTLDPSIFFRVSRKYIVFAK